MARDVRNPYYCGLFYCRAQTQTTSNEPLFGSEKENTHTTFPVCYNNDGSEQLPVTIVDRAFKLYKLIINTGAEQKFDNHTNEKT